MTPRLTIGVPVYNGERYLAAALAALAAQTLPDCVILLSDNGSTDRTPQIMAEAVARDPRFRIIRRPETLPVLAHFGQILAEAEGEYFMFAAYDDLWSPDYAATLCRALEDHPEAGLAVGATLALSPDGDVISAPVSIPPATGSPARRARYWLAHGQSAWIYGLFRRPALLAAWQLLKTYPHVWGHDYVVLAPFLLNDRIICQPEALFFQRHTGLSAGRYKPATRRAKAMMLRDFLRSCRRALRTGRWSPLDRVRLSLSLLRYANRRVVKFRRLLTNRG